jgi:uncharacterized integral membrane protein
MADEPRPPPPAPEPRTPPSADYGEGRELPIGLILAGLLLVYGVLFIILNSDEVDISFVFFSTRVSLVIALVLAIVLGFAAGYLVHSARIRRRRKQD